jgi:hypothetical protein
MAINFGFSSKNAHALLVKLNVDENLLKQLEGKGWTPVLNSTEVALVKGDFSTCLPITVGQMNNLYSGKLSVGELHQLKHGAALLIKAIYQGEGHATDVADLGEEVEELVGEPLEMTGPAGLPPQIDQAFSGKSFTGKAKTPEPFKSAAEANESLSQALGKMSQANTWYPSAEPVKAAKAESVLSAKESSDLIDMATKSASAASSNWAQVDVKKLKTLPVCKLREAKKMYQPVHGSSTGSRYFMVAGNADLRIAARFKGGTLSVRIEGDGWAKHAQSMATCGFDTHGDKSYASVHLAVGGDLVLANKTLGALIMGLGIPMETPYPNLSLIKEA